MTEPLVLLERPNPEVIVLRLNRPDRLNAITFELLDALNDAITTVDSDDACRAAILTGAGRGFCSGSDMDAAAGRTGAPVTARFKRQELFAGTPLRLRALSVPVIAAVNGACVGAGFGLAMGADIRLAGRSAVFHIGAVRRGLSAGECGLSYALPRAIGTSRAFEILLTGRPVDSTEAEQIGLVSRMVDDDQLFDEALAVADDICANSPFGISMTKQAMWRNLDNSLESAVDLENRTQIVAGQTADFKEAVHAWTEHRTPEFRGV